VADFQHRGDDDARRTDDDARRAALRRSFDGAAATYLTHAKVQCDLAAWLAEWLPVQREGSVLEGGAGPGVFTRHLGAWNGSVVATDLSPLMCQEGQRLVPEANWRAMLAEEPLPGPWDWIVSSSALQWATNPEALFAAWLAVMKPAGRALFGLYVEGTLSEWAAVSDGEGPLPWRTEDHWTEALSRAGWTVLRAETCCHLYAYESAIAFLRSLHAVGAAPVRRTSTAVLRKSLTTYAARFPHEQGGVRATWRFFRCEARA